MGLWWMHVRVHYTGAGFGSLIPVCVICPIEGRVCVERALERLWIQSSGNQSFPFASFPSSMTDSEATDSSKSASLE
jgi:hypothetical protein